MLTGYNKPAVGESILGLLREEEERLWKLRCPKRQSEIVVSP